MYIEPNTVIKFYNSVPLDNTYRNTLWFDALSDQRAYFSNAKYTLQSQSFQRVTKGKVRVQLGLEQLYDCNYLAFQNGELGAKWFYAFIISSEYVNNTVTEITFEIDVMQTYLFDITLKPSLVEREHTDNDKIGNNTVPENLELGDYVSYTFDQFLDSNGSNIVAPTSIVVASTFDNEYTDHTGGYYGHVFSGNYYNAFSNTTEGAIECSNFIKNVPSAKKEGITSVFIAPSNFITELGDNVKSYNSTVTKLTSGMFDGYEEYTVKNNKLYTYPYNFLYVTNLQGNYAEYHYEYFADSDNCEFLLTGDMSCDPTVMCIPKNYKGVPVNYDEKLSLGNYPQCTWNTDTFSPWLAQNAGQLVTGTLGTSYVDASRAWSMSTPGGYSHVTGAYGSVTEPYALASVAANSASTVAKVAYHAAMPPQAHGSSGRSAMIANSIQTFAIMKKHIRAEYARIIDDYFSMYGYATHKVKIPNRNVRKHWTYTKTIGCTAIGKCPADDIRKICAIYDNGITFWKKGSEVGSYWLDNPILNEEE